MRSSRIVALSSLLVTIATSGSLRAGDSKLVLKKGVFPTYPACASEQRVQGTVRIKTTLNSEGRVIDAIPIGSQDRPIVFPAQKDTGQIGYECLCKAAQKAAASWGFEIGATPPEVVITFRFEFVDSPSAEDLYPVFLAPSEVRVRGAIPIIVTRDSDANR